MVEGDTETINVYNTGVVVMGDNTMLFNVCFDNACEIGFEEYTKRLDSNYLHWSRLAAEIALEIRQAMATQQLLERIC